MYPSSRPDAPPLLELRVLREEDGGRLVPLGDDGLALTSVVSLGFSIKGRASRFTFDAGASTVPGVVGIADILGVGFRGCLLVSATGLFFGSSTRVFGFIHARLATTSKHPTSPRLP